MSCEGEFILSHQIEFYFFDIRMSVHRNIIPNYSQQSATFFDLFIFTDALHVSGGSSMEMMALVPLLPR